jgi:competence protein ComEC
VETGRYRVGAAWARVIALSAEGQGARVLPLRLWRGRTIHGPAWLRAVLAWERAEFDPVLLVPPALGLGILLYFAAPEEPSLVFSLCLALALAAAAGTAARRGALGVVLALLALVSLGFAAATLRTAALAAPILAKPLTADVEGAVLSLDRRANGGARIMLRVSSIAGLARPETPVNVRLSISDAGAAAPGDSIKVRASLRPPSPPAMPGGYDFARDAYFNGIGAVGFALGSVQRLDVALPLTATERVAVALDRSRNALTERIVATVPGENGAVAASQVTGKRGLIPDDANEALRASGLYHVVSISGLHMALFAGGLFWLIRAILALSVRAALAWPLKGAAALLSLAPAAAYTVFSGAEIATLRAFLMTATVLVAVALGRNAITRRNVAIAATVIILTTPEALVGPSFQMSFAAVAMLVAWHDRPRTRRPVLPASAPERALRRLLLVGVKLVVTTLIASLATGPFAAYHFHRLTLQSLAANVIAAPLVSGLMMPAAVLALVAEPFGFGAPFWSLMGVTVGWFMQIARTVASWPGAQLIVPQVPPSSLCLYGAGLVGLTILRTRLALGAALPIACGLALVVTADRPVGFIGAGGYAVLAGDGPEATMLAQKREAFVIREWLLAKGDARQPTDPGLTSGARCDKEGCTLTLPGGETLALDTTLNAAEEDCGRVAVLVLPFEPPKACGNRGDQGTFVIGREAVLRAGSFALFHMPDAATGHGWSLVPTRPIGSFRPWMPAPATLPPPVAPASSTPSQPAEDPQDQ